MESQISGEDNKMKIIIFKNSIQIHLGLRCDCGKYNNQKPSSFRDENGKKCFSDYMGIICDKCGTEIKKNGKRIINTKGEEVIIEHANQTTKRSI